MPTAPRILMTRPDHYGVTYAINPWMTPESWAGNQTVALAEAATQWQALADALGAVGFALEILPGQPGLPDMVFPANAAIVFDGIALVARFRHPERQGEEAHFHAAFEALRQRGLLSAVHSLPEGVFQEGAGDCLWDASRQLFFAAHGPRSSRASIEVIAETFGQEIVRLELVDPRFYHLDTCFCVLPGGEVLTFTPALSTASLERLRAVVAPEMLIEADFAAASAFSINAVAHGREVVMANPPASLRALLEERGYHVHGLELGRFMQSGGGSYCMTLRLDRRARAAVRATAAAE
ncbi:amidinotransferase [Rhodospirillum rubrum F11]|uniref:Amidinotransferase n=1 Tax=Rhodospirillum rubrum (strain ATCC 11170 / ATH 1.1.1 / DSM 467 / LMG 4362 / NCIMB 8255 / S1) TaxID=269796 RepID=Q2RNN4_RHORT|nr:arginine deiminase-related protein [Rhodospirillum rubrum]ABC24261.1 Amidinotransferase [Rhodospirillum rubrum ATCC 11170]AEO50012.1 amidinotransferase [Rhodospirillum rubrum F11]QXG80191.1 amidinotransferase [Rhodospirillum rubrum]